MKKGREKSISCWGGNLHEDKEVRKKYSPGLHSDAMITLSKTTVKKEKVYLAYSCIPLLRKDKLETQGRNLEAGTEVETIGEPLLPAWLPMTCSHAMLSLLSSTPGSTHPGVTLPTVSWAFLQGPLIKSTPCVDMPTGHKMSNCIKGPQHKVEKHCFKAFHGQAITLKNINLQFLPLKPSSGIIYVKSIGFG